LLLCPEGAATYAAYLKSLQHGQVSATDHVVLFNCATGLKYPLPRYGSELDIRETVDYANMVQ